MTDEVTPETKERRVPQKIPRTLPLRIITRLEGTGRKISDTRKMKLNKEYKATDFSELSLLSTTFS